MKLKDLVRQYEIKKNKYRNDAFKHISELFAEAKSEHKKEFLKSKTAEKARKEGRIPDHEQSWRAFKGKNYEKLVLYIIEDMTRSFGLKVVSGNKLERSNKLKYELDMVKRKLLIDYGKFGSHLPDIDIVVYEPSNYEIVAVISCKITLRERIAQTAYWKLKLSGSEVTEKIKVYFVTTDEDGTLVVKHPAKKGRAICEVDMDGAYVMREIKESEKVKMFDKFIKDLRKLLKNKR